MDEGSGAELVTLYDPLERGIPHTLDIVLVHGLMGDKVKTWTHASSGVVWPRDLLPRVFPGLRVLSFGYNAEIYSPPGAHRPWSIGREIARRLARALSDRIEGEHQGDPPKHKPMIFLAHCIGGLIAQLVVTLAARTDGKRSRIATADLILYGTLQAGLGAAEWTILSKHFYSFFEQLTIRLHCYVNVWGPFLARDSMLLQELRKEFIESSTRIGRNTWIFYEVDPLPGTSQAVVGEHLARTYSPLEIAYLCEGDHFSICQFYDYNQRGFRLTCRTIEELLARERSGRWTSWRAARRPNPVAQQEDVVEKQINTPLCDICARLDFATDGMEEHVLQVGDQEHMMGQSHCPLCQLVLKAISEERRLDPDFELAEPSHGFTLQWHARAAPGGRAGFKVDGLENAWIGFTAVPKSSPMRDPQRRYLLPRLGPVLDAKKVLDWVGQCDATHNTCRPPEQEDVEEFCDIFPGLQVIRFLDLRENCLAEKQSLDDGTYVALSYVWGEAQNSGVRLTHVNKAELMRPGSLLKIWRSIPGTIADAITLVRKLGIRYLWVDSICLVQNDDMDLLQGLDVMDRIYERAHFTIVAACGHDAKTRLPGVVTGSRQEQMLVQNIAPGVTLGVFFGPDAYLRRSVYETRAWTFQEHIVSPRVLYFTSDRAFFRCREAEFLEICEDHLNPSIPDAHFNQRLNVQGMENSHNPLEDYAAALTLYTKRALTNQGDALRALAGVMRRFSDKLGYPMLQGLPAGALDSFILFTGQRLRRRSGFPSYSWAGWRGEMQIPHYTAITGTHPLPKSWIDWHKLEPGSGSRVRLTQTRESEAECRWSSFANLIRWNRSGAPAAEIRTGSESRPTRDLRPYPTLHFHTVIIRLRIRVHDLFQGHGHLLDMDGKPCGGILLDDLDAPGALENYSQEPQELVVLSIADSPLPRVPGFGPDLHATDSRQLFNVMLVIRDGPVMERRGIGTIQDWPMKHSHSVRWDEVTLG